jgi:hypothetical protein
MLESFHDVRSMHPLAIVLEILQISGTDVYRNSQQTEIAYTNKN